MELSSHSLCWLPQALQSQGNGRLNTATGVLAAILIIAGLLPQYWEVWKYKAGERTFRDAILPGD